MGCTGAADQEYSPIGWAFLKEIPNFVEVCNQLANCSVSQTRNLLVFSRFGFLRESANSGRMMAAWISLGVCLGVHMGDYALRGFIWVCADAVEIVTSTCFSVYPHKSLISSVET